MSSRPARLALFTVAAAMLAGCGKKEAPATAPATVTLVADAGRSAAFLPTVAHLDVGGPVFSYCETEGDPLRVAHALLEVYKFAGANSPELPPAPAPEKLADAVKALGLANLHATGFSSRRDGAAYVNRAFLYTPGGPTGLTTLFGAKNADFSVLAHAPAGTLVLGEGEFDGKRLLALIRQVVPLLDTREEAARNLERFLTTPLPNTFHSPEKLAGMLSGKTFFGLGFSKEKYAVTEKISIPAPEFALALDAREPLFRELAMLLAMTRTPMEKTDTGDFEILAMKPIPGSPFTKLAPVLALQKATGRVWLASDRATFDAWTATTGEKLTVTPTFRRLADGLSVRGTGLFYVAPEAVVPVRDMFDIAEKLAAQSPLRRGGPDFAPMFNLYRQAIDTVFPAEGAGIYAVSLVTSDGLATESRSPISNKPNAYLWMNQGGAAPVIVGGVGAAMAIPAFKKVRNNAVEKTMLNDARQISSAMQQVMTENAVLECTLGDLIGPNKFIYGLSSGVTLTVIPAGKEAPAFRSLFAWNSPAAKALVLRLDDVLVLGHEDYDRTLSTNPAALTQSGDRRLLSFTLENGNLVR